MLQRGRKSGASLTVAATSELRKLPDPPGQLTPEQGEIWRMVIASRAGDFIDPEAFPVLVEYCRAVVMADQIAEQLAMFDPAWLADDDGLKRWDRLSGMQNRVQGTIASLGGKLCINPSTRVHKDTAGRNAARGAKRKPWETE